MADVFAVLGRSKLQTPSSNLQRNFKLQAPMWIEWLPLLLLPLIAFLSREHLPAWLFMWAMVFALYLGCKWLTWLRAWRGKPGARPLRSLSYFLLWPGMDAESFLSPAGGKQHSSAAWIRAGWRTLAGAALLWLAGRESLKTESLWVGSLGMIGVILLLHFGVFDLLAAAWRAAGIEVKSVMRAPLRATSLGDFWGRRWNTAFNTLAHHLAFRPLARRWGRAAAMMATFAISGVIHELVISVPARGGYGLPTVYFLFQGLAVLVERSNAGRRIGLGRGLQGWLFTAVCTAGPAFWLFHPPFVRNVLLPMLRTFGCN